MKVAIVSRGMPKAEDPVYGIFEFDQAKALAGRGVEVAFIAIDFRSWNVKRKYGLFQYEKDGVRVFELSLPINRYRKTIPILQRLLLIPFRTMLKSFGKPDVVHAHFYKIGAIAAILKKKYHIPFVITEHCSEFNKPADQINYYDKQSAYKAFPYCDLVISVSETLRENILKLFGHDSIVIPNVVDNQSFNYNKQPKSISPFVYVSVGNLIPRKGFDILIKAFAQTNNDANLYIIGEGPERKNLEAQIQQLGLQQQLELLGRLERTKINEVFQKCNAFALASQNETFGVCYIEAMYTGLPVIATCCGGPEFFVKESDGIIVPVNDMDSLVEALKNIRNNYSSYDTKKYQKIVWPGFLLKLLQID
jgi:glycosyltransferase involved in cell wall biosynthesis